MNCPRPIAKASQQPAPIRLRRVRLGGPSWAPPCRLQKNIATAADHDYRFRMVAQRLFDEFFALPIPDQVEVLQRLRNHLVTESEAAELTGDVRALLDARLDAIEKDGDVGLSWEEVARTVHDRLEQNGDQE